MEGDDRRRFCFTCSKSVYDLSAMTEDEAESFLAVHLIALDGSVSTVLPEHAASDLHDQNVVACIMNAFADIRFPKPEREPVTVRFPITFQASE